MSNTSTQGATRAVRSGFWQSIIRSLAIFTLMLCAAAVYAQENPTLTPESLAFPAAGGTLTVEIGSTEGTAYFEFADNLEAWCTRSYSKNASMSTLYASGGTLSVTCEPNTSSEPRTCSLALSAYGGGGTYCTLAITQAGAGEKEYYNVTVVHGDAEPDTGVAGTLITITAAQPEAGYEFDKWTGDSVALLDNALSSTAKFTMPASDITFTANYVRLPEVKILGMRVADKAADGTTTAYPTYWGDVVNADEDVVEGLSIDYSSATVNFETAAVGEAIPVTATGLKLVGETASQYYFSGTATCFGNIVARSATRHLSLTTPELKTADSMIEWAGKAALELSVADSALIEYGKTLAFGQSMPLDGAQITLSGLEGGAVYYFRAECSDGFTETVQATIGYYTATEVGNYPFKDYVAVDTTGITEFANATTNATTGHVGLTEKDPARDYIYNDKVLVRHFATALDATIGVANTFKVKVLTTVAPEDVPDYDLYAYVDVNGDGRFDEQPLVADVTWASEVEQEVTLSWTIPANTPAGTQIPVRLRLLDAGDAYGFAGETAAWDLVLNAVPSATKNVTLTLEAGANGHFVDGSNEPITELVVPYGSDAELTLLPNEGYSVEAVYVNGSAARIAHKVTVKNVRYAQTVSATFTNFPSFYIDVENDETITSKEVYKQCAVEVYPNSFGGDKLTIAMEACQIKGRGNSTWSYAKKPYRLKFSKKQNLFNMGKEKNYVLLANYIDPSGLRNDVAFEMGRRMGVPFTDEAQHVRLIFNGQYAGLYQLTEQCEVKTNRVDVTEVDAKDGPYGVPDFLAEFDTYTDEYMTRTPRYNLPMKFKQPEILGPKAYPVSDPVSGGDEYNTDTTYANWKAATDLVKNFENALKDNTNAKNFGRPDLAYEKYINAETFADWLIVHMIAGNYEPKHPKSSYFHANTNKESTEQRYNNGKITAGVLWDFDWAYGYGSNEGNFNTLKNCMWFGDLFQYPEFQQIFVQRWKAARAALVESDNDIYEYADGIATHIEVMQNEDIAKWKGGSTTAAKEANTFKSWLKNNIAKIDYQVATIEEGLEGSTHAVVCVNADTALGTVSCDSEKAVYGGEVVLNVTKTAQNYLTFITVNDQAIEPVDGVYAFRMPNEAVTVASHFVDTSITYSVTVNNGTAAPISAYESQIVTLTAAPAEEGYVFKAWTGADVALLANARAATTTFAMPAKAVEFTATYVIDPVLPANVIVVSKDGNDENTGRKWSQAFLTLDKALSVATSGTQIWVAEGTYIPSVAQQCGLVTSLMFKVTSGVSIYGGFATLETSLDSRVMVENGKAWEFAHKTILDGNNISQHVIFCGDGTTDFAAASVINGVTIQKGYAGVNDVSGGGNYDKGGAAQIVGNVTISQCVVENNKGQWACGGIRKLGGGQAKILDCLIRKNTAINEYCGGIMIAGGTALIARCDVSANACGSSGVGAGTSGGGIQVSGAAGTVIDNCLISHNDGVGVSCTVATTIKNCTIVYNWNKAKNAEGGVSANGNHITLANTILVGNHKQNAGLGQFGKDATSGVNNNPNCFTSATVYNIVFEHSGSGGQPTFNGPCYNVGSTVTGNNFTISSIDFVKKGSTWGAAGYSEDNNYGLFCSSRCGITGASTNYASTDGVDILGYPRGASPSYGAYEGSYAGISVANATVIEGQGKQLEVTAQPANATITYMIDGEEITLDSIRALPSGVYEVTVNAEAEGVFPATVNFTYRCLSDGPIYVAANGDDANLGQSWAAPLKSIAVATTAAQAMTNPEVRIAQGNYTVAAQTMVGGVAYKGGWNTTTGDRDLTARPQIYAMLGNGERTGFINNPSKNIDMSGIIFNGIGSTTQSPFMYVESTEGLTFNFDYCDIINITTESAGAVFNMNNNGAGWTLNFSNGTVENCRGTWGCLLHVYTTADKHHANFTNVKFLNNSASAAGENFMILDRATIVVNNGYVSNPELHFIGRTNTACPASVYNTTFINNGGHYVTNEITISGGAQNVGEIVNCYIDETTQLNTIHLTPRYCAYAGATGNNIDIAGIPANEIIDANGAPVENSILINNGLRTEAAKLQEFDLAGNVRVQVNYPDIGAFESEFKGYSAELTGTPAVYTTLPYAGTPALTAKGTPNAQESMNIEAGEFALEGTDAGTYDCNGTTASFDYIGKFTIEPAQVQKIQPIVVTLPDDVRPGAALDSQWIDGNPELVALGANNEQLIGKIEFDAGQFVQKIESQANGVFTVTEVVAGREAVTNYAPQALVLTIPAAKVLAPVMNVTPLTQEGPAAEGTVEVVVTNEGTKVMEGVTVATTSEFVTLPQTEIGDIAIGASVTVTATLSENSTDEARTAVVTFASTSEDVTIVNAHAEIVQPRYTGPAVEGIVYVDASKIDDACTGANWQYAKKTIAGAVAAATASGARTIYVAGGEYPVTATVNVGDGWTFVGSWNPETNTREVPNASTPWIFANPSEIIGWEAAKHSTAVVTTAGGTIDGFVIRDGHGGGISNRGNNTRIVNCVVRDNEIVAGGGFAGGIGLANPNGSNFSGIVIDNCWVHNNTFYSNNDGWTNHSAGGISAHQDGSSNANITNSWVTNNRSMRNGASGSNGAGVGGLWIRGNTVVANCLVANNYTENEANRPGGILSHKSNADAGTKVINCTVVNNSSAGSGSISAGVSDIRYIYNSIITNNGANGSVDVTQFNSILGDANDLTTDPLFVNPSAVVGYDEACAAEYNYDYSIKTGSEAIDAGDQNNTPSTIVTDLNGYPRVMGENVDIGAYEAVAAGTPVGIALTKTAFVEGVTEEEFIGNIVLMPASATLDSIVYSTDAAEWSETFPTVGGAYYAKLNASHPAFADAEEILSFVIIGDAPIYVSTSGDDANSGSSWDDAVASISKAFEYAAQTSAKTVYAAAETYDLSATLVIPSNCTFVGGWNTATDVVDGHSTFVCTLSSLSLFTVEGGTTENATIVRNIKVMYGAKAFTVNSNVVIDNCIIDGFNSTEKGTGTQSWGSAFELGRSANVIVQNTIIQNCIDNNDARGYINVGGAVTNVKFLSCLFDGNTNLGSGAAFLQGGSWTFTNCTFVNNTRALNCYSAGNYTFTNCIFWGNTAEDVKSIKGSYTACYAQQAVYQGITALNAENDAEDGPNFMDPSNDDYTLASRSMLINAGVKGSWELEDKDLAGNQRVQRNYVDVGAYESAEKGFCDAVSVQDYPVNYVPTEVTWNFHGVQNAQDAFGKDTVAVTFEGINVDYRGNTLPMAVGQYKVMAENTYFNYGEDEFYVLPAQYNVAVSGGTGTGVYNVGDTVTVALTAATPTHYKFDGWQLAGATSLYTTDTTFVYTVEALDVAFAPVFSPNTFNVAVNVVGGTGSGTYFEGQTVTVALTKAEIPAHFKFTNWTKNDVADTTAETFSFVVDSPLTASSEVAFAAQYVQNEYRLIAGCDSATVDTTYVVVGDTVTLIAKAPAHFAFQNWKDFEGNVLSDTTKYVFNMPAADTTVFAFFYQTEFKLTVNGGTATKEYIAVGDTTTVTYTGTPAEHFDFAYWKDANDLVVSTEKVFDYTMGDDDAELTAVTERSEFQHKATIVDGTMPASDTDMFYAGENFYVQYTEGSAPKHFKFAGWSDDNGTTKVSAQKAFFYVMKDVEVTLSPIYEQYEFAHTLTVINGTAADTQVIVSDTTIVTAGEAPEHYTFKAWLKDSEVISEDAVFTFTMPDTDVELTATFVQNEYVLTVVNANGTDTHETYEVVNEPVTVTAAEVAHYAFTEWVNVEGERLSVSATYTFDMPVADYTVIAKYDITGLPHTLTVTEGTPAEIELYLGDTVTVSYTGTPAEHYRFKDWRIGNDIVSTQPTFVYTMPNINVDLVPTIEQYQFLHEVTVVNGTPDTAELYVGEKVELTADEAQDHFRFVNWTWSLDTEVLSEDTVFEFVMPDTKVVVTANYEQYEFLHTLTVVNGTPASSELYVGDTVVVTADAPANHFRFKEWSDGTTDAVYTFTMPDTDVELTAVYEQFEFDHVLTVVNRTTTDTQKLYVRDQVTLTADDPAIHDAFISWTDGDKIVSTEPTFTYTMVDADVTLTANYEQVEFEHVLTINNGITVDSKLLYVRDTALLVAEEVEGKRFKQWSNGAKAAEYVFTMPDTDYEITAEYYVPHTLTVVNGTPSSAELFFSDTIALTADTPAKHFKFVAWKIGDEVISTQPQFVFTMRDTDVTLTAQIDQYEFIHTLTVKDGVAADTQLYVGDTTIVVANAPAEHYRFTNWTQGGEEIATTATFAYTMVDRDAIIQANYEKLATFNLFVKVNGATSRVQAYETEIQTVSAEPIPEHFRFVGWKLNGGAIVDTNIVYSFPMPSKLTRLEAITEEVEFAHTLTVVNGTPASSELYAGDTIVITAEERVGAIFTNWTIDTEVISTEAEFLFTMGDEAVTVTANFEPFTPPEQHQLTIIAGMPDSVMLYAGDTVTIVANEPGEGLKFNAWTCAGYPADSYVVDAFAATTVLTMPDTDLELTAMYLQKMPFDPAVARWTETQSDRVDVTLHDGDSLTGEVPFTVDTNASLGMRFKVAEGDQNVSYEIKKYSETEYALAYTIAAEFTRNLTIVYVENADSMTMLGVMFDLKHSLTVTNGTAERYEGTYGDIIDIAADTSVAAFDHWELVSGNGVIKDLDQAATMFCFGTDATVIKAVLAYPISVSEGIASVDSSIPGANVTITANEPAEGMMFNAWTGDIEYLADSTAIVTTFTMPEKAVAFTATYKTIPQPGVYHVLTTIVNGVADTEMIEVGTEVTKVAPEFAGATFVNWTSSNGVVCDVPTYTFFMPDTDYTIEANYVPFVAPTYTLTVVEGTPASATLAEGDTIVITANERAGATFKYWSIGDLVVSEANPYTFTMGDTDVEIVANFEPFVPPTPTYTLTVVNGTPDSAVLAAGDTIIITAEERIGATFTNWTIGETVVSIDSVFEFTMLDTDVTITANFEAFVPPEDPVYNLTTEGTVEGIILEWNHDGVSKSYDVYRDGVKVGSVKATGDKVLTFFDGDVNLSYDKEYKYTIMSKQTKKASEPVAATLAEVPITVDGIGAAQIFAIAADSVASDKPVTTFVKPSFAAYYTDPVKGKTKKVALGINKATLGTDSAHVYFKSEVALFNSKNYNKRSVFSHEYLADTSFDKGQLTALPTTIRVKKADAAHKGELRTTVEANFLPPYIRNATLLDITDTAVVFNPDSQKLTVKLNATRDYEVQVLGSRFGIKNPKSWVESKDAKGKIKKTALKVVVGKAVLSEVTKSKVTRVDGSSACSVIIPTSKWAKSAEKGKLPTYESFVISTGKAFDAVEFELVK